MNNKPTKNKPKPKTQSNKIMKSFSHGAYEAINSHIFITDKESKLKHTSNTNNTTNTANLDSSFMPYSSLKQNQFYFLKDLPKENELLENFNDKTFKTAQDKFKKIIERNKNAVANKNEYLEYYKKSKYYV